MDMSESQVFDQDDLQTAVHAALVNWSKPFANEVDPLSHLLLVNNILSVDDDVARFGLKHAVDRMILENIEYLQEQDETRAKVLQGRFIEDKTTRQVAQELSASPDQVNRWQRAAINHLATIIYHREQRLRTIMTRELAASLPPAPYSQFFGMAYARQMLLPLLTQSSAPWMIALVGIGGIGKTSLADTLVRGILPTAAYDRYCWLRVENQRLSGHTLAPERAYELLLLGLATQLWPDAVQGEPDAQLENRLLPALKAVSHLIVIDNLESTAHIDYFVSKLAVFTEPSRVVLTSRARPSGETAVYTHSLEELPFDDAADLLRHHAQMIGLAELVNADTETIKAIYAVTGGNPLALKLVVSLAAVLPLPQILADLIASRGGPIEELYRHIYWETWQVLSPAAQTLLQAMPLVAPSGALPEQMQAICGLDADEFWPAVRELTARSLLEVQGSIQERRYGIHRLTETFLQTEITHWPEMSG